MPRTKPERHTNHSLRNIAERLRKAFDTLDGLATAMEVMNVDEIKCTGQYEMERGLAGVDAFVFSAEKKFHEALTERGHYRGSGAVSDVSDSNNGRTEK